MRIYDCTEILAREIRETEEYKECMRLKEAAEVSETAVALLKEYRRLQMTLQMAAVTQANVTQEEVQRFSQMSSLLYATQSTAAYLVAETRLQKMMGDIFKILTDASGLQMDLPGM